MFANWFWFLVLAAAAAATISDVRSYRIPNVITLPLAAFALGAHFYRGGGIGLLMSLEGGVYVVLTFAVLAVFRIHRLFMGDYKLGFALGAAFGYPLALVYISSTFMAMAAVAMVWILGLNHWRPMAVWDRMKAEVYAKNGAAKPPAIRMPGAIALSLGAVWAWWTVIVR